MPRTKSIEVYTFDELSDKAKERARQWYREGAFDYAWWDATYEDAKTCFGFLGYDIDAIYFSGFSSQGDGACFEGTWRAADVKPGKLQEHAPQDKELHRIAREVERLAGMFADASLSVKQRGHYSHEGCTEFDVDLNDAIEAELEYDSDAWKARQPLLKDAHDRLIEVSRDAMKWIYRQLEKEYEYRNADEQIDEEIRMNEYEFTAEGKRCAVI
jgi:hypothetical protein